MLGWFGAAHLALALWTTSVLKGKLASSPVPRKAVTAAGRDLNKEAGVLSSPLSGTDPALRAAGAVGLAQGAKKQPLAGSLQGQGVEAAPLHAGLQVFQHPH